MVIVIFCFIEFQNGSVFLMLSYPGCSGKEAVKWELLFYDIPVLFVDGLKMMQVHYDTSIFMCT